MNQTPVIEAVKTLLLGAMQITAPALVVGLVVTIVVALAMAVTQLQEQTLSFIPKMIALGLVFYFGGAWMFDAMVTLVKTFLQNIPNML